jgi:hypothetical protein
MPLDPTRHLGVAGLGGGDEDTGAGRRLEREPALAAARAAQNKKR